MQKNIPSPNNGLDNTGPIDKSAENNITNTHMSEPILVVKREHLFLDGAINGLKQVDFKQYADIISTHKQFLPRHLMEVDSTYKQIIPYLIFTHENHYFLMQRHAKAGETRLKSQFSLGIGGHIYQHDMLNNDIYSWAKREFHEEINYTGSLQVTPIGIVNDDSNEVGQVHMGFVFLLQGDSSSISIKSELASGTLISLDEGNKYRNRMESWSVLVYDYLLNR